MQSKSLRTLPTMPNCERSLKAIYLQHCVDAGVVRNGWCLSSEYRLDRNARRADLAILGGGRFVGIEFKSQRDTVKRLAGQMDAYLRVFDEVVLVVAEKHIEQALAQAPTSVAVYIANNDGSLRVVRQAGTGISNALCNRTMAQNLTKAQLSAMVTSEDPRLSRNQLLALADALPTEVVRHTVQSAFQNRYEATSQRFWRKTTGRTVEIEHLESLSRYAKRRKIWQQHKIRNDRFWNNWTKTADLHFRKGDQSSQSSSVSYFSSASL